MIWVLKETQSLVIFGGKINSKIDSLKIIGRVLILKEKIDFEKVDLRMKDFKKNKKTMDGKTGVRVSVKISFLLIKEMREFKKTLIKMRIFHT